VPRCKCEVQSAKCKVLDCRSVPSTLSRLECSRPVCGHVADHRVRHNLCPVCRAPLLARYDLDQARKTLSIEKLAGRPQSMWRYEEVLPDAAPVTLGEGVTPLIHARRLGAHLGLEKLYIKEERSEERR